MSHNRLVKYRMRPVRLHRTVKESDCGLTRPGRLGRGPGRPGRGTITYAITYWYTRT